MPVRKTTLLTIVAIAVALSASCGDEGAGSTVGTTGTGGSGGTGGAGGSGGAEGSVKCGDLTCLSGEVCRVQVGGQVTHSCAPDPCAPKPLSCACVGLSDCEGGFYCVDASNGQISCQELPDAG